MTERQRDIESLRAYVRQLADLMKLRDWRLNVDADACEPAYTAQIRVTEGQKVARIWVSWNFFAGDPEERRQTIIHELLHCHFDAADRIARHGMKEGQHYAAHLALEGGIDDVAWALAPHLPLPPLAGVGEVAPGAEPVTP